MIDQAYNISVTGLTWLYMGLGFVFIAIAIQQVVLPFLQLIVGYVEDTIDPDHMIKDSYLSIWVHREILERYRPGVKKDYPKLDDFYRYALDDEDVALAHWVLLVVGGGLFAILLLAAANELAIATVTLFIPIGLATTAIFMTMKAIRALRRKQKAPLRAMEKMGYKKGA